MDTEKAQATVTIVNELGLHVRAATQLVQLASSFECEVSVEKDDQQVSVKSIMGLLMLVASQGTVVTVCAEGNGAEEAVAAIVALIENRFGEER